MLALSSEYVSRVNTASSVTATGGSKDIFMKQPHTHTLAGENHQSDFRSEADVSCSLGDAPLTFIDHLMGQKCQLHSADLWVFFNF